MWIKELSMKNFRKYPAANFSFNPETNIILGENGSGKTSILEAIHTLGYSRSFKTRIDQELVLNSGDYYAVNGKFENDKARTISVNVLYQKAKKKEIKTDNVPLNAVSEMIGKIPIVSLTPEDGTLTLGTPEIKRAFFDKLFSQIDQNYLRALIDYKKTLKQRNALLLQYADSGIEINHDVLSVLDKQLIEFGLILVAKREQYFSAFKEILYRIWSEIEPEKSFKAVYISNLKSNTDELKESYRKKMNDALSQDKRRGGTSVGPHRDQYVFYLNKKDIRKFGSQGENKLALVALKFAEGQFLIKINNEHPIYLLDDLFAKLDIKRSIKIIEALEKKHQVFITSTDLVDLRNHGISDDDKRTVVVLDD